MAKAPSTNSQLKGVWVIDNAIDIRYYISDRQAARALAQGGIRPNLPQNLLDELHTPSARWFGEDGVCDATHLIGDEEYELHLQRWYAVQNTTVAAEKAYLKQRVDEIEKRLIEFKKNNTLPTPLVDTLHS